MKIHLKSDRNINESKKEKYIEAADIEFWKQKPGKNSTWSDPYTDCQLGGSAQPEQHTIHLTRWMNVFLKDN